MIYCVEASCDVPEVFSDDDLLKFYSYLPKEEALFCGSEYQCHAYLEELIEVMMKYDHE